MEIWDSNGPGKPDHFWYPGSLNKDVENRWENPRKRIYVHGGFSTSIVSLPEGTLIKNRPILGVDHLDLSPRNPTNSLLGVTSPVHRLTYR